MLRKLTVLKNLLWISSNRLIPILSLVLRSVYIKLIWAVLQAAAIDILLVNLRQCQKYYF